MSNSQSLIQLLKKKYNNNFIIRKEEFDKEQNCYVFDAIYNYDSKEILFNGKYNQSKILEDNLIQELTGYQLNKLVSQQLETKNIDFFASKSFLNYNNSEIQQIDISTVTVQSLIQQHPNCVLNIWIYFFSTIDKNPNYKKAIEELIQNLKANINHEINLSIDFWNNKIKEKGDLSKFKFGFGNYDENSADNPIHIPDYIDQSLKLTLQPNTPNQLQIEKLLIPYSEKRFKPFTKI